MAPSQKHDTSLRRATMVNIVQEKDAQISSLQSEIQSLMNQLTRFAPSAANNSNKTKKKQLNAYSSTILQSSNTVSTSRQTLARNASIGTAQAIHQIQKKQAKPDKLQNSLIEKFLKVFQSPSSHLEYLKGRQFARDLLQLNEMIIPVLQEEPRVVFLQSPAYVFGDIHGNLEDLHFFSDNIWRLGMSLTAGKFVFLGDYVDRGMSCLEVVAYLFALKLQLPHKVVLLRGNHETRDVNGWEEHYGERSFIHQCRARFGDELGYHVWESTNQVFDRLPLSAVIDQDIFCVHGGIPRSVVYTNPKTKQQKSNASRIQDIMSVPKVAGINPPYEHEDEAAQQVASDCIWSDPASEEQEATTVDPTTGYGESLRGGGAICFGNKAVTDFLQQQGYSYIMRAHEAHAEGVAVSKEARVFTVFSTSKDHNQGSHAMAGCILVDSDQLQVINRSPAYKNQYVHRRDSVSLAALSEAELDARQRLGLVTASSIDHADVHHNNYDWEDFDETLDDDDEYIFDHRRSSNVDPSQTVSSPDAKTDTASTISESSNYSYYGDSYGNRITTENGFLSPLKETEEEEEDIDEISTVDGSDNDVAMNENDWNTANRIISTNTKNKKKTVTTGTSFASYLSSTKERYRL